MYKYLFFIFLGLFCYLTAGDFVVGTTSGYAPFVSINEEGQYEGFDIDVARELSGRLNKNLVLKDIGSMPALFLALKQGKVDALIWAISIIKERQEKVEMIYYQGEKVKSLPLLFWKKIPDHIKSINDMAGQVICTEAGSFQENYLRSVQGLSVKNVDKVTDAIMEIKYAKSAATMIDPSLLTGYKAQFPEIQVLNVDLPEEQQSHGNSIVIDKKNERLSEDVKKAISEMQRDGTLKTLEDKWGLCGKL